MGKGKHLNCTKRPTDRTGCKRLRLFLESDQTVINMTRNWTWVGSQCLDMDNILLCKTPGSNYAIVNGDVATAQEQGYFFGVLTRQSTQKEIEAMADHVIDAYDAETPFFLAHDPKDDEDNIFGPLVSEVVKPEPEMEDANEVVEQEDQTQHCLYGCHSWKPWETPAYCQADEEPAEQEPAEQEPAEQEPAAKKSRFYPRSPTK